MERVCGTCVRARVVELVVVSTCVGWVGSSIDGGGGDGASCCWRMASGRVVGISSSWLLSKGMICGASFLWIGLACIAVCGCGAWTLKRHMRAPVFSRNPSSMSAPSLLKT